MRCLWAAVWDCSAPLGWSSRPWPAGARHKAYLRSATRLRVQCKGGPCKAAPGQSLCPYLCPDAPCCGQADPRCQLRSCLRTQGTLAGGSHPQLIHAACIHPSHIHVAVLQPAPVHSTVCPLYTASCCTGAGTPQGTGPQGSRRRHWRFSSIPGKACVSAAWGGYRGGPHAPAAAGEGVCRRGLVCVYMHVCACMCMCVFVCVNERAQPRVLVCICVQKPLLGKQLQRRSSCRGCAARHAMHGRGQAVCAPQRGFLLVLEQCSQCLVVPGACGWAARLAIPSRPCSESILLMGVPAMDTICVPVECSRGVSVRLANLSCTCSDLRPGPTMPPPRV